MKRLSKALSLARAPSLLVNPWQLPFSASPGKEAQPHVADVGESTLVMQFQSFYHLREKNGKEF